MVENHRLLKKGDFSTYIVNVWEGVQIHIFNYIGLITCLKDLYRVTIVH